MCRLVRGRCIGFSLASTKGSAKSEPRSSGVSRLRRRQQMVSSRLRAKGNVGQVGVFRCNRASQLVSVGSADKTLGHSGASPYQIGAQRQQSPL
jgi:hypothetical protein